MKHKGELELGVRSYVEECPSMNGLSRDCGGFPNPEGAGTGYEEVHKLGPSNPPNETTQAVYGDSVSTSCTPVAPSARFHHDALTATT